MKKDIKLSDDSINIKGYVGISVYDAKTGELLKSVHCKNLVVTIGRESLAHLIAGDVSNNSVTKIGFGVNGTATALSDSALTSSFVKSIGAVTYPSAGIVKWDWTLEDNEYNGNTIKEIGLITTGNTLFSRITRAGIVKTSDIRLVGTWQITF